MMGPYAVCYIDEAGKPTSFVLSSLARSAVIEVLEQQTQGWLPGRLAQFGVQDQRGIVVPAEMFVRDTYARRVIAIYGMNEDEPVKTATLIRAVGELAARYA